ncbi:MAG: glycosyl transferase family protein [uncultured bacterium]|nr:MAG: glycosyl transferase family protein [uncultured bacterium]
MYKKYLVSVGIPVFNEEKNIKSLLLSILNQKKDKFKLAEIIIISDGSDDKTIEEINKVKSKNIRLIIGKDRLGKPKRLNQLFKLFKGNILVTFDGDIKISNKNVIEKLVKPFHSNKNTSLVCGIHLPLPPITFIENVAYFGFTQWDNIREENFRQKQRDYCTGAIRAFSKKFLKEFKLPDNIGYGEDSYSYYYAKTKGYKVVVAKEAKVYFRLASTFNDYTKQMSRFFKHRSKMVDYFGKETIRKYEKITKIEKCRSLLREVLRTPPHIVFSYLVLQSLLRVLVVFYKQNQFWDISQSTKTITAK